MGACGSSWDPVDRRFDDMDRDRTSAASRCQPRRRSAFEHGLARLPESGRGAGEGSTGGVTCRHTVPTLPSCCTASRCSSRSRSDRSVDALRQDRALRAGNPPSSGTALQSPRRDNCSHSPTNAPCTGSNRILRSHSGPGTESDSRRLPCTPRSAPAPPCTRRGSSCSPSSRPVSRRRNAHCRRRPLSSQARSACRPKPPPGRRPARADSRSPACTRSSPGSAPERTCACAVRSLPSTAPHSSARPDRSPHPDRSRAPRPPSAHRERSRRAAPSARTAGACRRTARTSRPSSRRGSCRTRRCRRRAARPCR